MVEIVGPALLPDSNRRRAGGARPTSTYSELSKPSLRIIPRAASVSPTMVPSSFTWTVGVLSSVSGFGSDAPVFARLQEGQA